MSLTDDALARPWYAVVDDTIGGWALSIVDKPVSEHDHRAGEYTVGNFLSEGIARHLADLHNAILNHPEENQ